MSLMYLRGYCGPGYLGIDPGRVNDARKDRCSNPSGVVHNSPLSRDKCLRDSLTAEWRPYSANCGLSPNSSVDGEIGRYSSMYRCNPYLRRQPRSRCHASASTENL
jgi:hypothetical protein